MTRPLFIRTPDGVRFQIFNSEKRKNPFRVTPLFNSGKPSGSLPDSAFVRYTSLLIQESLSPGSRSMTGISMRV